ncbi:GNAT family N-acetyltransferase [Aquaspirillum soli]
MTITIVEVPREELISLQNILEQEKNSKLRDIWVGDGYGQPIYLAAKYHDQIVGVASISLLFSDIDTAAEIYKIYVGPNYRRKGVGQTLFQSAIELILKSEIKNIIIEIASDEGYLFINSLELPVNSELFDRGQNKFEICFAKS